MQIWELVLHPPLLMSRRIWDGGKAEFRALLTVCNVFVQGNFFLSPEGGDRKRISELLTIRGLGERDWFRGTVPVREGKGFLFDSFRGVIAGSK